MPSFWNRLVAATASLFAVAAVYADVTVNVGTLAPGESVTLTYDVKIDKPLAGAITEISHSASLSWSGGSATSDDPETNSSNDATTTPIMAPQVARFAVTAAAAATAGESLSVTVTALDAEDATVADYAGTVHFTSTDSAAELPADATLTNGTATFNVTFKTAGDQTVSVADTITSSLAGTSDTVAVSAAAATHFVLSAPATATAGDAFFIELTAKDAFGNVAKGYTGPVHLTSDDANAALPNDMSLVEGGAAFSVRLTTAGARTVTAQDASDASITGSSDTITVAPTSASTLVATAPSTATAGVPVSITVTAEDRYGNVATGYTGTVQFATADPLAVLPSDATLTNGTGAFSVTFKTADYFYVTATDSVSSAITGVTLGTDVAAAAATQLVLSVPANATAGTAVSVTVTAKDAFGNIADGYTGTVHFTSTDAAATLPTDIALVNGMRLLGVTYKTAGARSLTVTDTVNTSLTASASTSVAAGAATHFSVSASASATAGNAFNATVTAFDAFNNVATAYVGTVHFTSSDGAAVLPANAMLTSGAGTFSVTLKTAGTQSITATDTVSGSVMGTANVSVSAATATHFSVSAPNSSTAGEAFNATIKALDQFNNTATGYAGTVHFTSSDGAATLPTDATLLNGIGAFSVTLKTAGAATVSATDTVTGSITGTSSAITVSPAAVTSLAVSAPADATAGVAISLTIAAKDSFGNTVSDYVGRVHFTSSDNTASLPITSNTTSSNRTFNATLKKAGVQSLTVQDTNNTSITGTTSVTVSPGATAHLELTVPSTATAGVAFSVTLTARDAYNNVATGYTQSVSVTSTDSAAVLPDSVSVVNGTATFSVTLKAAGTRWLNVNDYGNEIFGNSSAINVSPAAATHFVVQAESSTPAGAELSVRVTAYDAFENLAVDYAGTVHFTSTDPAAVLPVDATLVEGDRSFTVTLKTAGVQTVTATDTVSSTITGTTGTITVAAAAVQSIIAPTAGSYAAGSTLEFTLNFNQEVFVNTTSGTPTITFTIGGQTHTATYAGGSGTTALTFRYTRQAVDAGAVAVAGSSLSLNGATIRDGSGNDATLTFTAPDTSDVKLAPVALELVRAEPISDAPTNATSVTYLLTFSEAVTGVDRDDFTLVTSGSVSGAIASVTGVSSSEYAIVIGDLTGDGTLKLQLNTSGTGIQNTAGTALPDGGLDGEVYTFDHTLPTATSVSIASDNANPATAKPGDTVTLTFTTSEEFVVPSVTIAGHIGSPVGLGTSWSATYRLTNDDVDGPVTFAITLTDAVGNVSAVVSTTTDDSVVNFDRTIPAAPVITRISDDTGSSPSDGVTSDQTLMLHGTAEANSTVTVTGDGQVLGSVLANADGVWSFDHTSTTLAVGPHVFTATAEDAAGNVSVASVEFTVVIQNAPAITTQPVGGAGVADGAFTLSVTASGTGPLSYQWYRNGTAVVDDVTRSGATTSTLTLNPLTTSGYAGDYYVIVTNASGAATSATVSLTVAKADQTVTFPAIADKLATAQPFALGATASTGQPITYTVVSGPATIASGTLTLTGAGTVTVRAEQLGDANHNAASAERTFTVTKANASITLGNLAATYTGTAHAATATTTPTGLTVTFTYDGEGTTPVAAGSYAVSATIADAFYQGSATGTLVIGKATATVTLGALTQTYNGTPRAASVATNPNGLNVDITYAAQPTAPTNAGTYAVAATVNSANYQGSASGTLTITKAAQTITFDAVSAHAGTDAPFQINATASSGLPVTVTLVSGPARLAGRTVTLTGASGSVTLQATQAGDGNFEAAPDVTRTFYVETQRDRVFFGSLAGTKSTLTAASDVRHVAVTAAFGDIAAFLPAGSDSGSLLLVAPAIGVNALVPFTLQTDGTFSVQVPQTPVVSQTSASGRAAERDAQTLTLNGAIVDGVLTGTFVEIDVGFTAPVGAESGPSAPIAGLYTSSALQTSTGVIYTMVGANNEVLVLAITPTLTTGGTATVDAAGNFTVSIPLPTRGGTVLIQGSIDQPTTTVSGTLIVPDEPETDFAGLAVTMARTDRLINVSSRGRVNTGAGVLINGFVITGTQPKTVLVRAVGPGLTLFGVQGVLADPQLRVVQGANVLGQNDDWSAAANASDIAATATRVGAFALGANSKDAAMLLTLPPGVYSTVISGGMGVALAEVYDASETPGTDVERLVNLSTRGEVRAGENVLISGFVITGNAPKKVLVRGIGPALTSRGVADALADPVLKIYQRGTVVGQNDNWSSDPATAGAASAASVTVGAFPLNTGSKDAAIVLTLAPGVYSAQLASGDGTTGVGLIEVYEIPE